MKYQLIEEYFETPLFQRIVQGYFNTVLGKIIAENTTLSAKGLFIINGEVKRDFYDMPYHIHILNGLIPALFVYEKVLQQKGWTESPETELYLKIFILGFTFHDANKLLGTKGTRERGDLEIAVADLDNHVHKWSVTDFLENFETHKSTVYFLALSTEDRTFVQAEDYPITVNNRSHIKGVQRELCHLADGLASIQNEQLESIETLYKAIQRSLSKISKIIELPISYLKVRPNPYTLLSQNLLQVARKQLYQNEKKIFYATHEGFIFWGRDITNEEFGVIEKAYLKGSAEDINVLELTKITAQKCKFGFIGSIEFTPEILEEITTEHSNKFLGLSPNGRGTINDFDGFLELTKKMIEVFEIPIDYEEKDSKLYLNFYEDDNLDDEEQTFRTVYNLHKIQWLNPKENDKWDKDLKSWISKPNELLVSEKIGEDIPKDLKTQLKTFNKLIRDTKSKLKERKDWVIYFNEWIYSLPLSSALEENDENRWSDEFKNWCSNSLDFIRNNNLNPIWDKWLKQIKIALPKHLEIEHNGVIKIKTLLDLHRFIESKIATKSHLLKTYLNFIKTYKTIKESDDIEGYIEAVQQNIINTFTSDSSGDNNVKQELFDRYFECKGNTNLRFLENYNPSIPIKKEMCAFTGSHGTVDYKAEVAFAMKARGFSNRTITTLNNNLSHIAPLFKEENNLRISEFTDDQSNLIAFYDFFETNLSISKEIIKSTLKSKNQDFLKGSKIEFESNISFDYDLGFQFTKIKTSKKVGFVEGTFWFVRNHIRLLKELGIRSYITNIGSNYEPHKEAFHFKNAPLFLKKLGWNKIRLGYENEVLDEMSLVLTFGKKRIESNLLKIAKSRLAYFSIYYRLKDEDKRKVYSTLVNFYKKYQHKFSSMTITQQLVEFAVKIDTGFKSSAEETWLIRTAFDYLRKYHKQGYGREDIIQKTCGEIFRKKRMDNPSMEAIKDFATAIYDDLFLKDWNGKVLTVNQEKDWIYQFAFLYREKSLEIARVRKSKSLKRQLEEKGKEITEVNVKALLPKEQKRYAKQYFETIKNL